MKLIDSNILIYSAYPDYAYLRPLIKDPENFTSAISWVEVLGYHKLTDPERQYFESVFSVLPILPINDPILKKAIKFRQQHKMKLGDAIIAASASIFDLELYTRNLSDFQQISQLKVINPVQER